MVCMCVCMYVCVKHCMYVHMHACLSQRDIQSTGEACIMLLVCIYAVIHTYTTSTYIDTCVHACMLVSERLLVYCGVSFSWYIHTYTHTHIHAHSCIHACMHACMSEALQIPSYISTLCVRV